MPVKKFDKIKAWSFSRYNDYQQCPFKAKLKHVDKLKEPGNSAMARGLRIHGLAEKYIVDPGRPRVPPELLLFKSLFKELRAQYKKRINGMVVEDSWAFRKDWSETVWNDWAECFVRIKLDVAFPEGEETLIVNDWKTGKYRPETLEIYTEQLELYALAALLKFPHVTLVKPRLTFLDTGDIFPKDDHVNNFTFTQADVPKLKKLWAKRIKAMMNDTRFAPRPNNKCKWCHFRKSNGGPCKF